jgi:hypothetical protein
VAVKKGSLPFMSMRQRIEGKVNGSLSPFLIAETLVSQVHDRVEWWLKKMPPRNTRGKQEIRMGSMALVEMRDVLVVLLHEIKSWRETLWPEGAVNLLTRNAFESELHYKELYEAERKRNNRLAKLTMRLKTHLSEERIEEMLDQLDRRNLLHHHEVVTQRELRRARSQAYPAPLYRQTPTKP